MVLCRINQTWGEFVYAVGLFQQNNNMPLYGSIPQFKGMWQLRTGVELNPKMMADIDIQEFKIRTVLCTVRLLQKFVLKDVGRWGL